MSGRPISESRRGPWPTAADYVGAVQDPGAAFLHPDLVGLRLRPGMMGLPAAATGQNAIVFDADGPAGRTALRCFTSVPARGDEAYRLLESMDLPDVLVPVTWCDAALAVHGGSWPVVTMPWIVGDPLQRWVGDHLHLPARIAALADAWVEACRLLFACGVAHGDLQHGNVLVTATGEIRIIDFDGVLLFDPNSGSPSTAAPSEVGHPNYQHPQRIEDGHTSRYVDTFSALLIHTSLRALVVDPGLWAHHAGENLVLAREDLFEPEVSEVFARMRRSTDPVVVRGIDLLARWCRAGVAANLTLGDALGAAPVAGRLSIPAAGGYRSRASEREAAARAMGPVADWDEEQRPLGSAEPDGVTRHAQYRLDDGAPSGASQVDGTRVRTPRELEDPNDRMLRAVVMPVLLGLTVGALLLVVATASGFLSRFLPGETEEIPRMLEVGSCFVVDAAGRVLPERCTARNDGLVVAEVVDAESCALIGEGDRLALGDVDGRIFCLLDR